MDTQTDGHAYIGIALSNGQTDGRLDRLKDFAVRLKSRKDKACTSKEKGARTGERTVGPTDR